MALRFIPSSVPDEQIKQQLEQVEKHGFINYFGMQRFGSYNVHTHEIGRECLLQNWKQVIRMLLGYHPEVDAEARERKLKVLNKVFGEVQDIDGAIVQLDPKREKLEKGILLVLRKHINGFYNAF